MIYLCCFAASFAFTLLTIYLGFDIAALGPGPLTTLIIARFSMIAFIMVTGFKALHKMGHKSFIFYIILPPLITLGTLAISGVPEQAAVLGALIGGPEGIFWVLMHMTIMAGTTSKSRGFELSQNELWLGGGAMSGALAGGFALSFFPGPIIIGSAYILLCLPVFFMIRFCQRNNIFNRYKQAANVNTGIRRRITDDPWRSWHTFTEGLFSFASIFLMPVWAKFMGLSGAGAGILNAAQMACRFLIAPFSGHLSQKDCGRDVQSGAGLKTLGWTPLFIAPTPLFLGIATCLWALGHHLCMVGLGCRWYKDQCVNGLAARELLLYLSRLAGCAIFIPLLYNGLLYFILAACSVGTIFFLSATFERRIRFPQGATQRFPN